MITVITVLITVFLMQLFMASLSKNYVQHSRCTERYFVSWGSCTDLMLSLIHMDSSQPYAHTLMISGFGFKMGFAYGRDFSSGKVSSKFFGFHSTSGELIWNEFWLGHKCYSSVWDTTTVFLYCKYFNRDTGELVENASTFNTVPFKTLKDTTYHSKDGSVIPIKSLDFYLLEAKWTSKFAKWFGLEDKFYRRKVSLMIPLESPVYVNLHQETICAYDEYMSNKNPESMKKLSAMLDERIAYFMMLDKNF